MIDKSEIIMPHPLKRYLGVGCLTNKEMFHRDFHFSFVPKLEGNAGTPPKLVSIQFQHLGSSGFSDALVRPKQGRNQKKNRGLTLH
jgi:hypothetical protein